uniref:F-box/kelch-repeat protein At1g80440-like n=2 Tax=Nicotiana sylvestris TaxID=4096 RepID=A0A1U7XQ20_NICSY
MVTLTITKPHGVTTLSVYDPEKACSYDLPPIPEMVDGLPMFSQIIEVGPDLMVIGGFDPVSWRVLDSVFIYNFKSMSWRRGADMPGQQRLLFGCSSDSEKMVLVTGGHNDDKNVALRSVLLYDVEKDKWIVLPNMVMERYECKCILTE